jgi:hypothetical protein
LALLASGSQHQTASALCEVGQAGGGVHWKSLKQIDSKLRKDARKKRGRHVAMARQFVFVYRGSLDRNKYNTEERLRKAGEFLLHAFGTHTASRHVVDDDTKVQVNGGTIELGCTLFDVGPTEEDMLVQYLKECVRTLNSLDAQKFAELGWWCVKNFV